MNRDYNAGWNHALESKKQHEKYITFLQSNTKTFTTLNRSSGANTTSSLDVSSSKEQSTTRQEKLTFPT